ncbi:MAG: hypothetical protein K8R40_06645 [Anaerolineaceae bacterium]|nr:hypothetical protein [Anaerolineaceae bacterium]
MKNKFQVDQIVILFLLTLFLFSMTVSNPFHGDESIFIYTSAFFEYSLNLDLSQPYWNLSFFTLCATMLPRYFIAAGRLIAGYEVEDLNQPYSFGLSREENIAQGRVPKPMLLFASRTPMVVFTIFSLMFFYLLLKNSYHWLAGLSFLGLILTNEIIPMHMLRAMSEAPLMGFFILSAILFYFAQKHWLAYAADPSDKEQLKLSYLFFVLCGGAVGLAASSKINAFLIGFAVLILMIYLVIFAKSKLDKQEKIKQFIRLGLFFVFAAILIFIVLNPFLYPQPFVRMGLLLKYRVQEISQQATEVSSEEFIEGNLLQRSFSIFGRLLTDFSSFHFRGALWINLGLFLVGIGSFIWKMVTEIRTRYELSLLTLIGVMAFPIIGAAFSSPLWWSRYFFFPELFLLLTMVIGGCFIVEKFIKLITMKIHHKPSVNP